MTFRAIAAKIQKRYNTSVLQLDDWFNDNLRGDQVCNTAFFPRSNAPLKRR